MQSEKADPIGDAPAGTQEITSPARKAWPLKHLEANRRHARKFTGPESLGGLDETRHFGRNKAISEFLKTASNGSWITTYASKSPWAKNATLKNKPILVYLPETCRREPGLAKMEIG
jgi:hypothetical protein